MLVCNSRRRTNRNRESIYWSRISFYTFPLSTFLSKIDFYQYQSYLSSYCFICIENSIEESTFTQLFTISRTRHYSCFHILYHRTQPLKIMKKDRTIIRWSSTPSCYSSICSFHSFLRCSNNLSLIFKQVFYCRKNREVLVQVQQ